MDGVQDSATITSSAASAIGNSPPPFLSKTYDMVDNPSTDRIVSWSKSNNSFVVWNVPEFARDLLPKYFKHNNFSSFVRQLNTYGFRKVDPDRWEFANEGFLRGQKHLLKIISRRKPTHGHSHLSPPPMPDKSVGSCVEVGKFGIEEEVERLKRDKNVLMQELVRLRQQQQTTDHQLQTVGERVQVMEQRQQQMMSFLAKAMQSPGFVAQLVQQQGESNRRINGGNKKRRLPNKEEDCNPICKQGIALPNGQIVKYQPLMNEAAKSMLTQILKMNGSPRLESTLNSPNNFVINNMPSFSDRGSSSSQVSGMNLSKALPLSSASYLSGDLEIPASCSSAALSEVQSSPCLASGPANAAQNPAISITPQEAAFMSDFSPVQAIMSESATQVSGFDFQVPETGNTDPVSGLIHESIAVVTDDFSSDPDVDNILDEVPKLPGINDVFWEQFLSVGSHVGDSDEISSDFLEGKVQDWQQVQESGWDKLQHMNHLTEQMGLLAAEARRV